MNVRAGLLTQGFGVRCARPGEGRAIAALLARAFADDPVMSWMLPDPSGRERRAALYFRLAQRRQRPRSGAVRVAATRDGRLLSAALWSGPGQWQTSPLQDLRAVPRYVRVFGPGGLRRAAEVQNTLHEAHPHLPHWYLPTVGTDPEVQGTGAGSALLREQLALCDLLGESAYLESSRPSNVPFYERLGFRVTGEIPLPDGGPTLWPMWRDPASTPVRAAPRTDRPANRPADRDAG
ncbi:GNAT family N-acetyltransferase [Streptomyces sp. NPDC093225]|uniref:GNAT family N-acetyltransferase n=1 Tax=Streptomyces sp. NPDC093225 TaxID=3366034 RepID=UPI0037F282BE